MIVKLLEKESELNEAFKAKLDKQEKDVQTIIIQQEKEFQQKLQKKDEELQSQKEWQEMEYQTKLKEQEENLEEENKKQLSLQVRQYEIKLDA